MHGWTLLVNYTLLHLYSELLQTVSVINNNNCVSPYNVDVTDYFPANLELTFRGEPAQDTLADFVVTIRRTDDAVEPVEEFYLNVVPIENAIILTPRITVRILNGKLCVLFYIILYIIPMNKTII